MSALDTINMLAAENGGHYVIDTAGKHVMVRLPNGNSPEGLHELPQSDLDHIVRTLIQTASTGWEHARRMSKRQPTLEELLR